MLVDDVIAEQSAEGWRLSAAVHSALVVDGERLHFTVHGAARSGSPRPETHFWPRTDAGDGPG